MAEPSFIKRLFRSVFVIPAIGVLVLVALWTGVLLRLSVESADILQATQTKADLLADALAQHTATTIHDIDVIALVVKREFELNPASINLEALQEEGFFSRATAAQVSVVDFTGRILQSTIPYAEGIYIADRQHFSVHRKPDVRGLYISKPMLGRVSGIWTIQLTRRLDGRGGSFAGVVVVSEDRQYLTREFSNVADLGKGDTATVFLEDGTRLSDGETERATRNTKQDQEQQIVARRPVPGYPLVVEISLSRADAMVPYTRMREIYLAGTAAFSLLFVAFVAAILLLVHRLSRSRNRLRTLSKTDALTGLWNRYGVLAHLEEMLAKQVRLNQLAVVYIDLGNLSQVNDSLGHEAGDQLLEKIAARLQDGLPSSILGRFGGDEFVAILTAGETVDDVYPVMRTALGKINSIFDTPVTLRGNVFSIRASIGISVHARTGDGASTLLREADEAMYSAKSQMKITQKTAWLLFSNEMREDGRRTVEAEQHLRAMLSDGGLELGFCCIRNLSGGAIWGYRAMPTILSKTDNLVPVDELISVTRENGLLGLITEHTLLQMCLTIAGWQGDRTSARLTYRLGKEQFLMNDCASTVRSLAREFEIAPETLVLEVPECAFLDEPVLAETRANELATAGVGLMLHGFSGGFASFALLEKRLFLGVVIHQCPTFTDLLAAVIERVTQSGRMVLLEALEPSADADHSPLVYVIRSLDASLAGQDAVPTTGAAGS